MELYIGGYAQGKLTYVRKKYPGAQIYDENKRKNRSKSKLPCAYYR